MVTVKLGPYFVISETENRNKLGIQAPCFDKKRSLFYAFRIFNRKRVSGRIKNVAYTNHKSITKKLSSIISNCPVKQLCKITLNMDGVFEGTYDRVGQPEHSHII